mgnify:CR=1 FL=1
MKDECDSKEGKLSFTGLDTAESNLILCKDDANERKASLLLISRVRLILYKDNANEWKESLLLISRVQLILYKDNANERKENLLLISPSVAYLIQRYKISDIIYSKHIIYEIHAY